MSECINSHFKTRVKQRIGVDIDKETELLLIAKIQNNATIPLFKKSLSRVVHLIDTEELSSKLNGRKQIVVV
jgi:hypothetical protein